MRILLLFLCAHTLQVLDIIFTAFFATEMGTKIISTGLCFGESEQLFPFSGSYSEANMYVCMMAVSAGAYVSSWWNILDGTVVIISILNFIPGGGEGMKFFRVLRTVRALRPLQVPLSQPSRKYSEIFREYCREYVWIDKQLYKYIIYNSC
eukprot:COSAG05_NODE_1395_length_4993_cov_6.265836_9_plen_151_part_00